MNFIKKNPNLVFGLVITLIFFLFVMMRVEFFDVLGLKLYDTWMKLKSYPESSQRIVVVDIDDASLEKLGRWPWPRSRIAECLNTIKEGNPRVIGLNIVFSEPEENAGLKEIETLEGIFQQSFPVQTSALTGSGQGGTERGTVPELSAATFFQALQASKKRLDRDSILARAISDCGNVVLPIMFKDSLLAADDNQGPVPALQEQALGKVYTVPGHQCPRASEAILPIPAFRESADAMGHINCAPDRDGTFRRERLFYEYKNHYIPSYSLAIAARYMQIPLSDITAYIGRHITLGEITIPLTSFSSMPINFRSPEDDFAHYSFFDVINDKIPARIFTNKIVLVALSAKGVGFNPLSTPMGPGMAFGDFTGNVVWSILNQQFIHLPDSYLLQLMLVLIIGLLVMLLFPRLKAGVAGGVFFALLVFLLGGSAYLFFARGLYIEVIYPLLLLVLGYIGVVTISYFSAEAGKEKVEGESAETNRMLGISFQAQGMLDMAFDKFRKVPMNDEMKDLMYNLGLDYERKRQFNKAAAVYGYVEEYDPKFKDVKERKEKLTRASETMVFGGDFGGSGAADDLSATSSGVRPTLGRYEIIKQLGKGAMGIVYLGQDPRINRTTAIKTVKFTDDFDEEEAKVMKQKFFREAESAGTLSHPNIVTIYDAGDEQDIAYIAMEYLEGDSLEPYAKKGNLLPMRKLIGYLADIAEGLEYAHQKGIVHRDIKPANVMLLKSGIIKITDFGIARITASSQTKTGVIKGTPFYMSPEQISGKKVDGRSDIFSLGVMAFQLLTGTVPFKGSSPAALMHKILNEPHPDLREINPKIIKPLAAIIDTALEKDVEKRYQSAGQMAAHLRKLAERIDAARQKKQQAGNNRKQ